ncbi:MAG: hypothetical protein QOD77_1419 [Thermoplasmata archaeon]|jgi:hypothetical protein|nr:hypothetical protein [Thermoplasmata archaeon]
MRVVAGVLATLVLAGCASLAPPPGLSASPAVPADLEPYLACTWPAEGLRGSCGPFTPTQELVPVEAPTPPGDWRCYALGKMPDWPEWMLMGRLEAGDGLVAPQIRLGLWYNLTAYAGGPLEGHFVRWTAPEVVLDHWTTAGPKGFVAFPQPVGEDVFHYEVSLSPANVQPEPAPFEWSRAPEEGGDWLEWKNASARVHADGLGGAGGLRVDWTVLPGAGDDAPRLWPTFAWQAAAGELHVPTTAHGWPGFSFGGTGGAGHGYAYLGEVYKARLVGEGHLFQAELRQAAGIGGAAETWRLAESDQLCRCFQEPLASVERAKCTLGVE